MSGGRLRPLAGVGPAGDAATLRVMAVDDSALMRQAVTAILSRVPGFEVETAADPLIAMSKMKGRRPDVILLDVEMPRMDGLTFLRRVMAEDPIPVVICSALTTDGTQAALRALDEGAVEVVAKPQLGVREFVQESALVLADALRGATRARLRRRAPASLAEARPAAPNRPVLSVTTNKLIALGASTGGTEALRLVLQAMPAACPGLVIVQHMPEGFTRAFAERLDLSCAIAVKEAADGDRILEGRALIAPGNRHLEVTRSGGHYRVRVFDGPLVSRHRPSVDVLFRSVARACGPNAVGIIMTGMGADGAAGLLEMRRAGSATIAQDERSSVVFGMPKEAIGLGAADAVIPLCRIAQCLLERSRPA